MPRIWLGSVPILAGLLLSFWASTATAQIDATETLDNVTTQTSRLYRDGIPSKCGVAPKATPATLDNEILAQDTYTITNATGSSVCYEIKLENTTPSPRPLFAVAYLGAFDPSSIQTNYLGDGGNSSPFSEFSVDVPAGATLTVVVHEVEAGESVGNTYRLRVAPYVAPIPTMTEWGMILIAILLAGGAAIHLQHRHRRV